MSPLRELARARGVSLFMVLTAAFKTLLHRYSGAEDLVIGTPVSGRHYEETASLLGFFSNTLALRTDLSGDPTFAELLDRVKATVLGALAYQELPFEKLVEVLNPERSRSHSPLFQVLFGYDIVSGATAADRRPRARAATGPGWSWSRFDFDDGAPRHPRGLAARGRRLRIGSVRSRARSTACSGTSRPCWRRWPRIPSSTSHGSRS